MRVPLREPLKWTGGIRESASGLIVEISTDEGLVGIGEAPGPTLPAIQTIIDREFAQFLVGEDPLRIEWLVHRLEEYSRNWSGLAAYAIAGIEMALLDLKGKALGVSVAELLGGYCREAVPVIGYLFIDEPEANAAQGRRVRRGRAHRAEAQGRARPRPGLRHARGDPRPRRLRRQDPDRREHELERPGGDQVDPGARAVRPPVRRAAGARLRPRRAWPQVRRAVSTPIAADEGCTSVRSALELIKAEACDVFVVYPSEAGGLTRACQIARARGGGGQVVRDRELGRARRRDDGERPRRRGVAELPVRKRHALSAAAGRRPHDAVEIEDGRIDGLARTRASASRSIPESVATSRASSSASHRSTTTSRATRRASARFSTSQFPGRRRSCNMSDKPTESSLSSVRSAGATC